MNHLRELGLSRDPFANDAGEGFYYESPLHRAAERRVLRGVTQRKGLCLLVGEAGAGKSTLARRVFESLEEEAYEASLLVLLQSGTDAAWLLARIARELGVEEPPGDEPLQLLGALYDRLAALCEEGRRAVVILDDAHLLSSHEALEALRALVDLEYEERQLLTLILVGEPDLDRVIALDPRLPGRLDIRVAVESLDLSTAAAYLGHRITAAGGHPSLLDADAVEALHGLARGLPRRLNVLADNALFEAHLAGRTRVTPDDVGAAARMLGWHTLDVGPVADTLPPPPDAVPPGGEPIDLTHEVDPGQSGRFAAGLDAGSDDDPLGAFGDDADADADAEKDEPRAAFFDTGDPARETVVMGRTGEASLVEDDDEGVDRDVDDLFDNLIDDD